MTDRSAWRSTDQGGDSPGRLTTDDRAESRGRLTDDGRAESRGRLTDDGRAVSVSVGYVLNLAVAALLLGGLFVAGGSFVQNERQSAVHGELTVVGERAAADLMTVDRLAASAESDDATVVRHADLPPRVSGSAYRIVVESDGNGHGVLLLTDERTDAEVEVPFRVRTGVENTTVGGGDLTIRWDAEENVVVVKS